MKRELVLITGGSGNIGRAVAERLKDHFQIVCFDVTEERNPISGVHYEKMDVSSPESVREALSSARTRFGDRIASFLHLAAYYSFSGGPSPKYDEITVRGTETLIRELRSFQVEQFIFSSTMLVHAPLPPGKEVTETTPVEPSWEYPESKVKAEQTLHREHGRIPIVNLRIAGVYDDRCHSIPLANHIKRLYERQFTSFFFPGNKSHGQAFVHVNDLVEAFAKLIEKRRELPPELTLLIGEPETLSFETLQERLGCLIHDQEWRTVRIPSALAKTGAWVQSHLPFLPESFIKPWMIDLADDHYDLDVSRAQTVLGWAPKHSLDETLPKMAQALKSAPEKWYQENKLPPPNHAAIALRRRALTLAPPLAALALPALIYVALRRLRATRTNRRPPLPIAKETQRHASIA